MISYQELDVGEILGLYFSYFSNWNLEDSSGLKVKKKTMKAKDQSNQTFSFQYIVLHCISKVLDLNQMHQTVSRIFSNYEFFKKLYC